MEQSLSIIQDDVAKAPKKASGAFSRMATPGQKRAYWARVSSGEIDHREGIGYVRTNTLARKWTTKIRRLTSGMIGEVGNNTIYAKYVQGLKQQSFHAASKWARIDKVFDKNKANIERIWNRAIDRILKQV
jgi:hypothetical protein